MNNITLIWNHFLNSCSFFCYTLSKNSARFKWTKKVSLNLTKDDDVRVSFFCNKPIIKENTEALVLAQILPCMIKGKPLLIKKPISTELYSSIKEIFNIFQKWDKNLKKVRVRHKELTCHESYPGRKTATFFSAGVDSFYTLLKNLEEIDSLIFVHGFDLRLNQKKARKESSALIHKIGKIFHKEVIEIETDIKPVFLYHYNLKWVGALNGIALACTGYLLSSYFKKIYIPSSYALPYSIPSGEDPLFVSLLSSEKLSFERQGGDTSRIGKIRFISRYDCVHSALRVCW